MISAAKLFAGALPLVAACLFAAPAAANDSTAELGAGGLAYITTDKISMGSEDLSVLILTAGTNE